MGDRNVREREKNEKERESGGRVMGGVGMWGSLVFFFKYYFHLVGSGRVGSSRVESSQLLDQKYEIHYTSENPKDIKIQFIQIGARGQMGDQVGRFAQADQFE